MSVIPKAFFPVLTSFSEFSRKKIKINTIGKDTASPGELTQILLPEGKLDMTTFSLGGLGSTTTTTNTAALPPANLLIEQIMVEVGSVQLHASFNWYNQVWQIMSDYTGQWTKVGINQILNLQRISGTVTANHTDVPFQINKWLGFIADCSVLLCDRLPPVRISIRWAQPNVLVGSASAPVGASYSLKNLYATVDVLKLSPAYDALRTQQLVNKIPIQIPYTNYQCIPGVTGGLTNVTRFSSTADALERVYGTFLQTTYQNPNQVGDGFTFVSPAFNRGTTNLASGLTSRFTINGMSFPDQAAVVERGEVLLQTLQTLNEDHDVTSQVHPSLITMALFGSKFFVHGNNFSWNDSDSLTRKCGLTSLGQQLICSWETNATQGQADTAIPLVILQSKAVLEVGDSRTVRVIY